MRKWIFWMLALAAALAAVTTTGSRSHAGIIGAPLGLHEAADDLRLAEMVQFRWRGHRYCWYTRGWRGAGWYRCGFDWRRGQPAGMDGGTQAARWLVRRGRAGRESSIQDRSPTRCRVGRESGRCPTGSDVMDTLSAPKHAHWRYISTPDYRPVRPSRMACATTRTPPPSPSVS